MVSKYTTSNPRPGGSIPDRPMVSVSVTTYNHENYIRECLDSILSQKTDFEFEVLLGEDHSTDRTRAVCEEYAKKYPDKIRLFLHDRSKTIYIGGNPTGRYNLLYNLSKAKGRYIALCDGDDFWTDPEKLQKQVDFMEANPNFALCFHPVKVVFENNEEPESIYPENKPNLTIRGLLKKNFIQTNSVLYRRQKYEDIIPDVMPGDWYLHLYHAQFGKIGYVSKVMSVYRRHEGGLWWNAASDRKLFWEKYALPHLLLYEELLKMYGSVPENREIIYSRIQEVIRGISYLPEVKALKLVDELMHLHPKMAAVSLLTHAKQTQDLQARNDTLTDKVLKKDETISRQSDELKAIKSSLSWRLSNRVNRIVRRKK